MISILFTGVEVASPVVAPQVVKASVNLPKLVHDPGNVANFHFSTQAQAAAVIDVTSGRILWHQQGNKQLKMASTTKIMTAIVALENGKLSDQVEVSKNAFGIEGSSLYLEIGEKMSLEHLLYGLMLRSGNDAAVAIAEHIGGSVDGFVTMMNDTAKLLNLKNTNFTNPHGLDHDLHYTSADDLAYLTAYALKNPTFRQIVKTKTIEVPNPLKKWDYRWYNKNKLLSMFPEADGVKTGYTSKANRCLVSSATRNGQQIAVVTLNDKADWVDHQRLFEMAFRNYPLSTLTKKNEVFRAEAQIGNPVDTKQWKASSTLSYPLKPAEKMNVKWEIRTYESNTDRYALGKRAMAILHVNAQPVAMTELIE